jgi:hypothetical protein
MLPIGGITLQQNFLKISELLPDLWWMDNRQYSAPCNPCLKRFTFFPRNLVYILKEIKVQVGKSLPCSADPIDESLSFSPVMGLTPLDLQTKYS